jgi:hypothetical protein
MQEKPAITHHFKVQFTHPRPTMNPSFPGTEYESTMFLGVMAQTIDDCIAAVRREYPRATIYTVSHQGKIQIEG